MKIKKRPTLNIRLDLISTHFFVIFRASFRASKHAQKVRPHVEQVNEKSAQRFARSPISSGSLRMAFKAKCKVQSYPSYEMKNENQQIFGQTSKITMKMSLQILQQAKYNI